MNDATAKVLQDTAYCTYLPNINYSNQMDVITGVDKKFVNSLPDPEHHPFFTESYEG